MDIVFSFPQNALDINNKTALNLCENVDRPDSQACAKLLRAALRKPVSRLTCSYFIGKINIRQIPP